MKNFYPAIITRELREHSSSIFLTPLILGGIIVVSCLIAAGLATSGSDVSFDFQQMMEGKESKDITFQITGLNLFFAAISVFACAYYLLDCLYADRKDRSILFWRSMPVSEYENVAAKILTSVFLVPTSFFVIGSITAFLANVIIFLAIKASVLNGVVNYEFPGFGSSIVSTLTNYLALLLISLSWLPLHMLIACTSALAKRSPFFYLILALIGISLVEFMLFQKTFFVRYVVQYMKDSAHAAWDIAHGEWRFNAPLLMAALGMSASLYAATVWLRKYRFEI